MDAKSKKQIGNLYDHIINVINHIVECCPDKALERFEEISHLLKNKDTLAIKEFIRLEESRSHCSFDPARAKATQQVIDLTKTFFVSRL